jgi:malate dehydrogenase (oxaloacetate-decarboxylating)
MDYAQESLNLHAKHHGKMEIASKFPLETIDDLSLAYTPGVAEPCRVIAQDESKSFDLTMRGNTVAVVSDGSAVLGLGNIGGAAAMPVMEGKCLLFKKFGGVDAMPICLDTQDTDEIVETVVRLAPTFGGINLEDISAPRCFEIEKKLKERLDIPVFHDDQHGTAIVVLAGLQNALQVVDKKIEDVKIVCSGSGAAGIAIAKLLINAGGKNIVMCDSKGVIHSGRTGLNEAKQEILKLSSLDETQNSTLPESLAGADVFIGVSKAGILSSGDIATMNKNAIVFAMANPVPEIMPDEAKKGGAGVIATGRSDFPNQVNNVLAFPGLFKGLFQVRATEITPEMNVAAANALSSMVENPTPEKILPSPLQKGVAEKVAEEIVKCVGRQ